MSPPSKNAALNRIPELDGLRGIAILLVLFYHFFWFPSPGWTWAGLSYGLWRFAQVGWMGVNIFFVLSGFLITRILIAQKEDAHYFSSFYKRRVLRIFPLYLATLTFIYFYYPGSGKFVLLSMCFLAHVPQVFQIKSAYPTLWSLSVEEQFYFIWPWIVKKCSPKNLLKICLLLLMIEPLMRGISFVKQSQWPWIGLFTSFDGFAVGGILALGFYSNQRGEDLQRKGKRFLMAALLMWVLLMPFGLYTRTQLIGEMFLPSNLYLWVGGAMAFSMLFSGSRKLIWLSKGFLPLWGKLSYGAYLCHFPVHEWVEKGLGKLQITPSLYQSSLFCLGRAILSIAGTFVLAYLLHLTLEEPFLKLKDRKATQLSLDEKLAQ